MTEAFFRADGARFVATEYTRGPWDPGLQHGGPPSALLARAFEALAGELRVVRLTVELLRPIPIASLEVTAEITRAGRKAAWFSGVLRSEGKDVARATATAIRTAALGLPAHERHPASMPPPAEARPFTLPFFPKTLGYHRAMELMLARGTWSQGPCAAWMRMRVPLVEGETPSPLQRVVVAADAGNGVSITLPLPRFTVVNADLTVDLHRLPEGEWVGLDAITIPEADGRGLAEARLHDERGPIGRSLQTLVVEDLEPSSPEAAAT